MRRIQRRGHLSCDVQHFVQLEPVHAQVFAQSHTLDILHRNEARVTVLAEFKDRQHVRMVES